MHREHEAELQISNSSLNRRYINKNISHLRKYNIQGVRLERSKSYCLLLLKYENYGLFNPTGGSPDVVHLIK